MKAKVTFVKLKTWRTVSPKAMLVTDWSGNSEIIPTSQVFGEEDDGLWIASWILPTKSIVYTRKRECWYVDGSIRPIVHVQIQEPERVNPVDDNTIDELCRR